MEFTSHSERENESRKINTISGEILNPLPSQLYYPTNKRGLRVLFVRRKQETLYSYVILRFCVGIRILINNSWKRLNVLLNIHVISIISTTTGGNRQTVIATVRLILKLTESSLAKQASKPITSASRYLIKNGRWVLSLSFLPPITFLIF